MEMENPDIPVQVSGDDIVDIEAQHVESKLPDHDLTNNGSIRKVQPEPPKDESQSSSKNVFWGRNGDERSNAAPVEKILVVSFQGLQLQRISELQDELLHLQDEIQVHHSQDIGMSADNKKARLSDRIDIALEKYGMVLNSSLK
jgi:hypothetical protein